LLSTSSILKHFQLSDLNGKRINKYGVIRPVVHCPVLIAIVVGQKEFRIRMHISLCHLARKTGNNAAEKAEQ